MKREMRFFAICAVVSLLLLMLLPAQAQTPTPDAFSSDIFMWDGGDQMFVADGGKIIVQSGGEIELESGSTLDVDGTLEINGISNLTASGYFLLGAPTPAVVTTPAAGDFVAKDDVEIQGDIDVAGSGEVSTYLLVGAPTPAVVTTPAAGDFVAKDDVEIQGDIDVAGSAELDGGMSVDDVMTVANTSGNIATTGTLNVSPGASTLAALTVTDTLGVTGIATFSNDVIVDDDLELDPAASNLTITDGAALACTGSNCPLTAAGAVSTTLATVPNAGTVWVVHNTAAQAITLSDSGSTTLILGADRVLNQYDNVILLSNGSALIEIGYTDN